MKKCYLSENISIYRKSRSMTQSDLAQQLGVSHQAVSLWERGETLPDVALLPQLAEVLQTSVESLFQTPSLQQQEKAAGERAEGTEQQKETSDEEEPSFSPDEEKQRFASLTDSIESMVRRMVGAALETSMNPPSRRYKDLSGLGKQAEKGFSQFPFPDDGAVRAALFVGSRLCSSQEVKDILGRRSVTLTLEADCVQAPVYSQFSIECGDVFGPVSCGGDLSCGDIAGEAAAEGTVSCGDVEGGLNAGASVNCGDVEGDLTAGSSVECGDVGGDVSCGGDLECGDVGGSVLSVGGSIRS